MLVTSRDFPHFFGKKNPIGGYNPSLLYPNMKKIAFKFTLKHILANPFFLIEWERTQCCQYFICLCPFPIFVLITIVIKSDGRWQKVVPRTGGEVMTCLLGISPHSAILFSLPVVLLEQDMKENLCSGTHKPASNFCYAYLFTCSWMQQNLHFAALKCISDILFFPMWLIHIYALQFSVKDQGPIRTYTYALPCMRLEHYESSLDF